MTPHGDPVAPELMSARVQYEVPGLDLDTLAPTPLAQFEQWIRAAGDEGLPEPNAMSLATCGPDGPAVRVILAKEVAADGIRFFTNLRSAKGREIAHDPRVSAVFCWIPQHRQVRFTGIAEVLSREESQRYFDDRPRGARVGAWASAQSSVLPSRSALHEYVAEVTERFSGVERIPLPAHWGGYLIRPHAVEFWQGQPSRLHDRLLFTSLSRPPALDDPDAWELSRLAP